MNALSVQYLFYSFLCIRQTQVDTSANYMFRCNGAIALAVFRANMTVLLWYWDTYTLSNPSTPTHFISLNFLERLIWVTYSWRWSYRRRWTFQRSSPSTASSSDRSFDHRRSTKSGNNSIATKDRVHTCSYTMHQECLPLAQADSWVYTRNVCP